MNKTAGEELTPCEIKVLGCLTKGYSNKRIAEALDLRPKTVKNHVTGILRKLNATSRTHAVTIALTAGGMGSLDKEYSSIRGENQAVEPRYHAGYLTCFCGGNEWLVPSTGYLKCAKCGQVILVLSCAEVNSISRN